MCKTKVIRVISKNSRTLIINSKAYESSGLNNFMINDLINTLEFKEFSNFIENDLKPNLGNKKEFYIGEDKIVGWANKELSNLTTNTNFKWIKLIPYFIISFRIIDTKKRILSTEAFIRRIYSITTASQIFPPNKSDELLVLGKSGFDYFGHRFEEKEVIDKVLERGFDLTSKGIISRRRYIELLIAKYLKII